MKKKTFFSVLPLLVLLVLGACTDLLIVADKADEIFVDADTADLSIGFGSGDSAIQVTANLNLPTSMQETRIVWCSDNPGVISDSGRVIRPAFDAESVTVTLEATITAGHETRTKTFTFTVLPLEPTDVQAIGADTLALEISLGGSDTSAFVTQDIELPLTGLWSTTITWASDKPGVVSAAGVVTSSTIDETVTMTATISRGDGISETKDFTFTVKATGSAAITIELPVAPSATALVFRNSDDATITTFTVARGSTVSVNTSFTGTYAWYVDSSASSLSDESSCSLIGSDYSLGFHTLVIDAVSGGKSYSGQIMFKVVTP